MRSLLTLLRTEMDISTIGIALETDGLVKGKAALADLEGAANKAADSADRVSASSSKLASQYQGMADAGNKAKTATVDQAYAAQVLTDRYLKEADAADKFMANLQRQADQFGKTRTEILQMQAAMHGVSEGAKPLIDGMEQGAQGAHKLNFASSGARRELMVLAHEMSQGNWTRFGGSLGVLAERTDALGAIMSPTGLAIGLVAGVLGFFAVAAYKGYEESENLRKSLIMTGNYAGLTAGSFDELGKSIANSANVGIGTGKDALQALASTGRVTGEAMTVLATDMAMQSKLTGEDLDKLAKDYAKMPDGIAKWAEEHNKSMHFMNVAQYEHIRLLEEQGLKQEAMTETGRLVNQAL
jgi:phage-related minor tail protein